MIDRSPAWPRSPPAHGRGPLRTAAQQAGGVPGHPALAVPQEPSHLRKALAAEGVTHQAIRGPAVLHSLDALRELHQAQWGSRSGVLPVFARFAAGFAGGCAADEVVVHELGNDDLVVATVTAFEVAGRVSLYQSARLTDRRLRDATTVLLAAIIDDACARGFNEVDSLRGDEPYKGRFTRNHREMLRLVAGQGVVGRLGGVTHAVTFQARQTAVRCVRFGRSTVALSYHSSTHDGTGDGKSRLARRDGRYCAR